MNTGTPPPAAGADAVLRDLRQRIKRVRRRVLDPNLLRAQLSLRWPSVRQAAAAPAVRHRVDRFRAASPAYGAACAADGRPLASIRAMTLDGMTWSVPLVHPDKPQLVERAVAHQDFPYRVITQTRDVSIGGTMIDIGANIGRMSVPRIVLGDALLAYCAEPDPLNYACLVRNVRDNGLEGLVLPDHLAIGAVEGTVRLLRASSAGGHRVLADGASSRREVVEVRCLPLDTWVERVGIDLEQVRFIKVDVQGSEVDVLRGAVRTLEHPHIAWQIEVDLETLAARGLSAAHDLYPLMQQHFTHFIDLGRDRMTARVRPVAALAEELSYVSSGSAGRTDVVLFTLDSAFSGVFSEDSTAPSPAAA
jgi:FkbM family methyltransferase